jgi:hypothetical protein
MDMKISKTFAAIFLLSFTASAHAAICISTDQIANSDSPDGKVLILRMKDGKVWHAALQPPCPDIRTNGFIWSTDGGQVCENAKILKVVRSGGMCGLGKFVSGEPPKTK